MSEIVLVIFNPEHVLGEALIRAFPKTISIRKRAASISYIAVT